MSEVRFWDDGWTPQGTVTVPPDYGQLPAGNAFATRQAKKFAAEAGRTVFVEMKYSKRGGHSRAVAYWVPAAVLAEVRRATEETEGRRAAVRTVARQGRARRHERELARL